MIYAAIVAGEAVYFFTLYGKNEQADLTPDEKKVFRQVLDRGFVTLRRIAATERVDLVTQVLDIENVGDQIAV